jgi:hypothetical protein
MDVVEVCNGGGQVVRIWRGNEPYVLVQQLRGAVARGVCSSTWRKKVYDTLGKHDLKTISSTKEEDDMLKDGGVSSMMSNKVSMVTGKALKLLLQECCPNKPALDVDEEYRTLMESPRRTISRDDVQKLMSCVDSKVTLPPMRPDLVVCHLNSTEVSKGYMLKEERGELKADMLAFKRWSTAAVDLTRAMGVGGKPIAESTYGIHHRAALEFLGYLKLHEAKDMLSLDAYANGVYMARYLAFKKKRGCTVRTSILALRTMVCMTAPNSPAVPL